MKIVVAAKSDSWQIRSLRQSAKRRGVKISAFRVSQASAKRLLAPDIDIVMWRSGYLNVPEKQKLLFSVRPEKLVNLAYQTQVNVPQKSYQQNIVSSRTAIRTIPTFYFASRSELLAAVEKKRVRLPLIAKPSLGSRGEGVKLIKYKKDADLLDDVEYPLYIFQTYIENDGDYRVFTVGGVPVSYMKRTAAENSFLNNISQGGSAASVVSNSLKKDMGDMASSIACLLDLNLCGVDFIIDKKTDEVYFMEVNTAPQWAGIQSITTHNISDKIIDYCYLLGNREKLGTFNIVRKNYDDNINFLNDKKFHYLSRMWLWTQEKRYLNAINRLKKEYIGTNAGEIEAKIQKILANESEPSVTDKMKKEREEFYVKYPNLKKYNSLLFKWLFAKNIYGEDIKPLISKYIKEEEFVALKQKLLNDKRAILILSTHAINYLYNLRDYLGRENDCSFFSAQDLYNLAKEGYQKQGNTLLELYFYTHCIIGESRFYYRKVKSSLSVYKKMLERCEQIIAKDFFNVALDNKAEFLVACRLTGYASLLEDQIQSEAEQSLSPIGNFLVDTKNSFSVKGKKNGFMKSEHRNVLYLMSRLPFIDGRPK